MNQAFILPMPESDHLLDPDQGVSIDFKAKLKTLQNALEKLKNKTLSFDLFFDLFDPKDPLLKIAVTQKEDTILHLAVIADLKEFPTELANDKQLCSKRNLYGLTAIDFSQYLDRGKFFASQAYPFENCYKDNHLISFKDSQSEQNFKNFSYLKTPIFLNHSEMYLILSTIHKSKQKDLIPTENTWMGIYFDREIQHGSHPPVSIGYVDDEVGFGVYAAQRIAVCSYVGEYTGEILEKKNQKVLDLKYYIPYAVCGLRKKNFIISAHRKGNFTRYINHSCDPNLSLQAVYWRGIPRMVFIAIKEIPEGTQLTFDYGTFLGKEWQQTAKRL